MPTIVINSAFFRDLSDWPALREHLADRLKARSALRVWSAGCHAGQEAYSLAILLDELAPGRRHRILATDRETGLIERARARGPYLELDLKNMTPARRDRYLEPGGPPYFVAPALAERVELRKLDLLRDAYEVDFDLIFFRNLHTCFTPAVIDALHRKLAEALAPGGALWVGALESVPHAADLGLEHLGGSLYRKQLGESPGDQQWRDGGA
jgi:chemotaxis protein methyltransferase CheR